MFFYNRFPRALFTLCLILGLTTITAYAQNEDSRPRFAATTLTTDLNGITHLENDAFIVSLAEPTATVSSEAKSVAASSIASPSLHEARLQRMLLAAIDTRIGARYVFGAAGPSVYDCSGFVWSVFQSAGISFDRSSARTLWSQFAPARPEEQRKLGTLVFFNGLSHIGIVADQNGFYHASRTHGVTYSPFKGYWENRIDGYRRVPTPAPYLAE